MDLKIAVYRIARKGRPYAKVCVKLKMGFG